jgi:hypothetical protein
MPTQIRNAITAETQGKNEKEDLVLIFGEFFAT